VLNLDRFLPHDTLNIQNNCH